MTDRTREADMMTQDEARDHAWEIVNDFAVVANLDKAQTLVAERFAAWVAAALLEAAKAGAMAERVANIKKLEGLMPLDSDSILDAVKGALAQGIQVIRLGRR